MSQRFALSAGFSSAAGRALRVAAAGLMLATLAGPLRDAPAQPPMAEAKNLQWGDVRPPLTSDNDSDESGGFFALPAFGTTTHAITVAPNGDVFVAGGTAGSQKVYQSINGGRNWRSATVFTATGATVIRQIAVSPDYPSDGWVGVVFSDSVAADSAGDNGMCWVTTWPTSTTANIGTCLSFADGGAFADVRLGSVALTPDFNWSNGAGRIAIGGVQEAGVSSVYVAQVSALKDTPVAADFLPALDASSAVGDYTVDLTYTVDEEPIALARLWVDVSAAATRGEVLGDAGWTGAAILTSQGGNCVAEDGQVGFDDDYTLGGTFFTAVNCLGPGAGGVYRFNGSSWSNQTSSDVDCNTDFNALAMSGNGSSTRIAAAAALSNRVCRSTNEGSSWTDAEVDNASNVCSDCRIDASVSVTRLASEPGNALKVYHAGTATLSGVSSSSDGGASWQDTGLTNLSYTVSSVRELDANRAFAVVANAGVDAIFYTDNYGTNAGWRRVLRTARTDLSFGPGVGELGTGGRTFARFTAATFNKVLVTSDGGFTWRDAPAPDPFAGGPDANELAVAESVRSGLHAYIGGDKGHVAVTTDGGAIWTILARDFGQDVDEFDFTSDPLVFFVTAEDNDNTNKVWLTRNGGATFTQVGANPWGSGDGGITLETGGYSAATDSGWLLLMTNGDSSTDEVYRLQMPAGDWEDLDLDVVWTDILTFATPGVGDGRALVLSSATRLFYTVFPFTGDKNNMTPTSGADPAKNLLLELPLNPDGISGTLSTALTLSGFTLQYVASNRVVELTLTSALTGGITPTSPVGGATVPTNVGDNGFPAVFQWGAVPGVDAYQLRIGLLPDLGDAFAVGYFTSPLAILSAATYPLIPGNTYYWAAQVQEANFRTLEGPYSAIASFNVVSAGSDGALGGTNLKISTGKPTSNAIDLAWDAGNPPGGFRISRTDFFTSTTVVLPPGGPLPGNATSYFDTSVAATTLYCYFVTPLSATGAASAASDTECAMTGVKNGAVVPADFSLSLGQSATTTLGWKPPVGGADNFLLIVLPLGGGASSSVALNGVTRGISREEATTGPTCYVLAGIKGAAVGNTDLLCSVPGLSTFAGEDGQVVAPAVAPGEKPGAPNGTLSDRVRGHILKWRSAANSDAAALLRLIGNAFPQGREPGRGGR